MIIVTGGSGFIGSNLVRKLNEEGHNDILVVDNLKNGHKFVNLPKNNIIDYIDKEDFIELIAADVDLADNVEAIFHQGACTDTTEWDGKYMMENNFEYTKALFHYAASREIPFIYASSAAVYGLEKHPKEDDSSESPLNIYGYSKYLFDVYSHDLVKKLKSKVIGFRYFNVYGHGEGHKGRMASMVYHWNNQIKENGKLKIFGAYDGYGDGEHRRDFIYVDDLVDVIYWAFKNKVENGVYNLGTGKSAMFKDLANAIIEWHGEHGLKGELEFIPFPDSLVGKYQSFTEADLTKLRAAGCDKEFVDIKEGVKRYLDKMNG